MGQVNGLVHAIQHERDTREQQPWRCSKCGTPIRPGRRDPCKCPGLTKEDLANSESD